MDRKSDKQELIQCWTGAVFVGLLALGFYIRTLAPDVLYGDSGEFQTLAYTLGYTHSTGYPIYLLLARLVGFLPVGNLAWRINLFSAISAAVSVGIVYLLILRYTRNVWGAFLGSFALLLSYTFWSQAIIAEVYTPAIFVMLISVWLLMSWQEEPLVGKWKLLIAAALIVSGVGVHASVGLLAPGVVVLVLWVIVKNRNSLSLAQSVLVYAAGGAALGFVLLMAGFLVIDYNDPLSSFYRVTLEPSRSIWGLTLEDINSPGKRFYYTFTGMQWQNAIFPQGFSLYAEFLKFQSRFIDQEFSFIFYLISVAGFGALARKYPVSGSYFLMSFIILLFFILNYQPPDKYVFYIPLYVLMSISAGCGIGFSLEFIKRCLKMRGVSSTISQLSIFFLLLVWFCSPYFPSRWQAIKYGKAEFVQEEYAFPVSALSEPRAVATLYLSGLPQDAVLITDWRLLYATLFVAHVEKKNPGLRVLEATPYGSGDYLADSLLEELNRYLDGGTSVFSNNLFVNIQNNYNVKRIDGTGLYQLTKK
jgi:hypothetical protein